MSKGNEKLAYSSFGVQDKEAIINKQSAAISRYSGVKMGKRNGMSATAGQLTSDHFIRSPFNRKDYENWRPNEAIPTEFKDIITFCRAMYLQTGVIRNVIDMMTDFAIEDFKIIDYDKKTEAFFKVWSNKVHLFDVIEEFARHLLIDYNVVVKRSMAKITKPVENEWLTNASTEVEKLYTEDRSKAREIPWKYSFLNVAALKWYGDDSSLVSGQKKLMFKLSDGLLQKINAIQSNPMEVGSNSKMPLGIKDVIKKGKDGVVEIDLDKVYITCGKKDSWEDWAPPFLYSIIPDVIFKTKLRQAETSALDGVINVIRLWKLGDHTNGILPNQPAVDKLIDILETNTGGGALDLVWDSLITMEEFYPPIDKILGEDKYTQVNRDILIGLGVPEVLIGGQGGNFSNSYIQLKTMVERLKFVRRKINEFVTNEIKIISSAMGFTSLAKPKFNDRSLEDGDVTRKLILGLLDRGIISVEAVHDVYGEDFLFEMQRIKTEKKILSDSGVKVKNPLDNKGTLNTKGRQPKDKPISPEERKPKPRTKASISIASLELSDAIDEYVVPIYMESVGSSNARKLTNDQKDEISNIRLILMSSCNPKTEFSEENMITIASDPKIDNDLLIYIKRSVSNYISENNIEPKIAVRKRIESIAWAEYFCNKEENE